MGPFARVRHGGPGGGPLEGRGGVLSYERVLPLLPPPCAGPCAARRRAMMLVPAIDVIVQGYGMAARQAVAVGSSVEIRMGGVGGGAGSCYSSAAG